MTPANLYVTRIIAEDGIRILQAFADVRVWRERQLMPRDMQLRAFADCDGILTTGDILVNEELISACPKAKVFSNHAVGYDNIDVPACTRHGVLVGNTPGVLSETTADLAFTLLLASARRVVELAGWVKQDQWKPETGLLENLGTEVHHATLGIIGMGRIGVEIARRATGFNMKILYHNRQRNRKAENEFGAVHVGKENLLRQSDFVSLNLPLTQETYHYIGANDFKPMKPSAILINTARGQLVDQAALLDALKSGEIAGAGLDVTDPEPMRADDPLLNLPQVTILPHVGSATRETRAKMAETAARNLINALKGQPMISCLNPEAYGKGRNKKI